MVYFLKKNYIIGLVLVLCFILFISAGVAGEGSEVVVGSVGFFGMVALLPLFLYLVLLESKTRREEVMVRTQIREEIVSQEVLEQSQGPPVVTGLGMPPHPQKKEEIDWDYIESLRAQQLDIPDKVNHVPEEESHDLTGGLDLDESHGPEDENTDSQIKKPELKEKDGIGDSEEEHGNSQNRKEEEQEKKEEDE